VGERRSGIMREILAERERQIRLATVGTEDDFDKRNFQDDWSAYLCAYAGRATETMRRKKDECPMPRGVLVAIGAWALAAIEAYDTFYQ